MSPTLIWFLTKWYNITNLRFVIAIFLKTVKDRSTTCSNKWYIENYGIDGTSAVKPEKPVSDLNTCAEVLTKI